MERPSRLVSDDTNSLVEELVVEAGKNVTLNCPGVTEDSLVYMLEWRANGMQLLEWQANGMQHEHANRGTDVWTHQNRVSLSLKNYALQFHPVTAPDSAKYECLINNRSTPDAVIKLIVQGNLFVSFCFLPFFFSFLFHFINTTSWKHVLRFRLRCLVLYLQSLNIHRFSNKGMKENTRV